MKQLPFIFLALSLLFVGCGEKKAGESNPRSLSEDNARIEAKLQRAVFQDTDGNEVYLADFEGKVVLIDFWETWCGPCLKVFPAMDSLRSEYPDQFEVLTVNLQMSDNKEDVIKFAEDQGYDFNFLLDVNNVQKDVITMGIPFKVFFDPNGFLISAELGAGSPEREYNKAREIIEDNKSL